MIPQQELTAEDIRLTLQEIAQEHLPFEVDGYICTDEMIYDVPMQAATEGISIDAVCRDLADSAAGNTIREIINAQLSKEQLCQHEAELNAALAVRQEWLRCFDVVLADAPARYGFPAEHLAGFRAFLEGISGGMVNTAPTPPA